MNSYCSYGKISVDLIRRAQQQGYFPSVRALGKGVRIPTDIVPLLVYTPQPEKTELMAGPPHTCPTPNKLVTWFSTWESTKLMPFSVSYLNRATTIAVPCVWNAIHFKKSGINRPIEVIRLGVDDSIFSYRPMNMDSVCTYGCAGNTSNGNVRKGVPDCIKIFQETFQGIDDVRLKIKVMPSCKVESLPDKRIELVKELMTEDDLANWYQSLTAFISFARGEGWGWHQNESMACGRPVVCAPYAGLAEFVTKENSYTVSYKEVPASEIWTNHGSWAEPNAKEFSQQLLRIYKNRKEAQEKGWLASQDVAHLTIDKFNDSLLALHAQLL